MHPRSQPPQQLLRIAHEQGGVVDLAQLDAIGFSRRSVDRLIGAGDWQRPTAGLVYVGAAPVPWPALAWAGILLGGPGARLGGRASAHLHGMTLSGTSTRGGPPDGRIEVMIPKARRREDRDRWTFIRESAGQRLSSIGRPPRLTIEDTVLDLCRTADQTDIIDLLTAAVQTRRTNAARLRRRLAGRARTPQRDLLEMVLGEVGDGAQSPLEIWFLRDVERVHGLPRGRRQIRSGSTVRDVYYDDYATVVELDGELGHTGIGRFRDMDRDNRSTVAGDATLRFGWHDVVDRPCHAAAMLEAVIRARGWTDRIRPCRRCER